MKAYVELVSKLKAAEALTCASRELAWILRTQHRFVQRHANPV